MKKHILLILSLLAFLQSATEKECQEFYDYDPKDRDKIMNAVKESALNTGSIVVYHKYFEDDNPDKIINKVDFIANCFEENADSVNQYLSKAYLARLYYRTGNFNQVEKIINDINDWLWDAKGTEVEDDPIFLNVDQFIKTLRSKLFDKIQNNSTDYATLTMRMAETDKGIRRVPEGILVDQTGTPIFMEILLPQNGDFLFNDPVKKKRYKFIKNNKTKIVFDQQTPEGSHEMKINYLPLLPQGEEYTFLIKDKLNGKINRYKATFDKYSQNDLDINFSEGWMIKLSAPEGKIKLWLPVNDQYGLTIEDNKGNVENTILNVYEKGTEYNIYLLESMQNEGADYDYKIIYEDEVEAQKSLIEKWGFRGTLILISSILIVSQMDK